MGAHMYEIVPGFFANTLVIILVNIFKTQDNQEVLNDFDEVLKKA